MLGVSPGRVSQLISSGSLESSKEGGITWVTVASIEQRLSESRKAGRPRKTLA